MPVNRERLLEHLVRMLEIDTPPRLESPLADLLEAELKALGFETQRDQAGEALGGDTGNLIAYRQGTVRGAPSLLFNAHMDTVQPTGGAVPVVEPEWIRSAGQSILGADDKAGIAIIMEALRSVADSGGPCGDLEVVFTICEEVGLEGANRLDVGRLRSRTAYVFDSGKPIEEICTSAPTQDDLRVKLRGKASHAGSEPEKGVSAIITAARAIAGMNLGRIDAETTANVGIIQGGKATNIIRQHPQLPRHPFGGAGLRVRGDPRSERVRGDRRHGSLLPGRGIPHPGCRGRGPGDLKRPRPGRPHASPLQSGRAPGVGRPAGPPAA